ncbi:DUF5134 domain-containing protein [Paraburkholderia sp. ZP32-5]|uniref:DUF5134 domain-containing protein n=1 Tax=Paraburkholderia sp. ZP32-5 TaxID=2883245 RepID=UPI001F2A30BC|nr:DUF5134 domain-containing protein [Paraburkholderia sp. ZP32-5]
MLMPAWLLGSLTTVMLGLALVNTCRLLLRLLPLYSRSIAGSARTHTQWHDIAGLDAELAQCLMAISMAGVLIPRIAVLPALTWQVVFVGLAAWFGLQCLDGVRANGADGLWHRHGVIHLLHCLATVYMFSNAQIGPLCSQQSGVAGYLTLAHIIAFVIGGECVWSLFRASANRRLAARAEASTQSLVCRCAMAMSMAIMLLTMN